MLINSACHVCIVVNQKVPVRIKEATEIDALSLNALVSLNERLPKTIWAMNDPINISINAREKECRKSRTPVYLPVFLFHVFPLQRFLALASVMHLFDEIRS